MTIPKNDYKKRMTFDEANKLLRERTKDSPFWHFVRRKATARLLEHNPEEIGSSDIACAATEMVQTCEILLPGTYKLIHRDTQRKLTLIVSHLADAYVTKRGLRGVDPLGGQSIEADKIHDHFEVPYATRPLD